MTEYHTKNPAYPEAHRLRYKSKRTCDCTWGAEWTVKVKTTKRKKQMTNHDETYQDRQSRKDSAKIILWCGFGAWAITIGLLLGAVIHHLGVHL